MATLKVKKVKGHEYFYWSKSVRSHKKLGGDGCVKTLDHLIGTSPVGQWLAYYLWSGDAELQQYAEATIKHLCPAEWAAFVKISIDWQRRKVSIRSHHPWFADCRSRRWQTQRKALQTLLDRILEDSTRIDRLVQDAGYLLSEHCRYSKNVQELQQMARDARLYPDNFVHDAENILNEYVHANQRRADEALEYYLQHIESLEKFAPPVKRLQFRYQTISRAEKLSENKRWLEEYQAKLESS